MPATGGIVNDMADWMDSYESRVRDAAVAAYRADTSPYTKVPWSQATTARRSVWLARARVMLDAAGLRATLEELDDMRRYADID